MSIIDRIPADHPVQPLRDGAIVPPQFVATCGTCGLSWDDNKSTSLTPVPSGRCPFEYFHDDPIDTRPILDLTYVSGRLCIGMVELDDEGNGVRSQVLSTQDEHMVTSVMLRRFDTMASLMGDNVQIRKDMWLTEDEAADEADHRNSDDPDLPDHQAWQTAYVNDGFSGDGFWTVTLENTDEQENDE